MHKELISEFRTVGYEHYFPSKKVIFEAGKPAHEVAYLVRGRVLEYRVGQNPQKKLTRVVSLGIDYPGSILGGYEALLGDDYDHDTKALEPCQTIIVRQDKFQEMIQQNPNLSLQLMEQTARRQRFSEQRVGWLHFLNSGRLAPYRRLAKILLALDEQDRTHGFNYPDHERTINLMSQKEIGGLILASREATCRAMAELENQVLLERVPGLWRDSGVEIKDLDQLRQFTQPTKRSLNPADR